MKAGTRKIGLDEGWETKLSGGENIITLRKLVGCFASVQALAIQDATKRGSAVTAVKTSFPHLPTWMRGMLDAC